MVPYPYQKLQQLDATSTRLTPTQEPFTIHPLGFSVRATASWRSESEIRVSKENSTITESFISEDIQRQCHLLRTGCQANFGCKSASASTSWFGGACATKCASFTPLFHEPLRVRCKASQDRSRQPASTKQSTHSSRPQRLSASECLSDHLPCAFVRCDHHNRSLDKPHRHEREQASHASIDPALESID